MGGGAGVELGQAVDALAAESGFLWHLGTQVALVHQCTFEVETSGKNLLRTWDSLVNLNHHCENLSLHVSQLSFFSARIEGNWRFR